MRHVRNRVVRIVSGWLILVIGMVSLWTAGSADVKAADPGKVFQLYIISETQSDAFVGDFLLYNQQVYVEYYTLEDMGEIEGCLMVGKPGYTYEFERGSYRYTVPDKETIELGDDLYFLMENVVTNLGLSLKYDADNRLLMVEQCSDLNALYDDMEELYCDDAISLAYWRNSFSYTGGYVAAVATDVISNMKFVSFLTATDTQQSLKEMVWKTILPSSEDELLNFMVESNKMVKTITKYKKYADNWSMILTKDKNSGFLGEWGEFFGGIAKGLDYMQFSEGLNAINYAHGLKNVEDSYMSGLKILLDSQTKPGTKPVTMESLSTHVSPQLVSGAYQSLLYHAVEEVYNTYKDQDSTWEIVAKEVVTGILEDALDELNDAILKKFVCKEIVSVAGTTLNSVLGMQDSVDATILAHDCLELQKWCKQYKCKHWGDFNLQYGGITQEELDGIKKMRDVGTIYLRTGVVANLASPVGAEDKVFVDRVISKINGYLSRLLSYQENDFTFVKDNREVVALLSKDAALIPAEETSLDLSFEEYQQKGGVLSVSYHQMSDGTELYMSVSGTAQGEAFYYAWSGSQDYEYRDSRGTLLFTVKATSGYYRITIEPGVSFEYIELLADTPDLLTANSAMGEMTPVLSFEKGDGTVTDSGSYETYYTRYPTGIWGMSVHMNMNGLFWRE